MKATLAMLVALTLAVPAFPSAIVEGTQVMYVGGTVPSLKEGVIGRLNTAMTEALVFEYGEAKVEILYASIQKFEYTEKLARRLGVIATIAVVLVKHRQRRHFVEINFRDKNGANQVAVFEVSKEQVQPVVAVLNARVTRSVPAARPRPCNPAYESPQPPCPAPEQPVALVKP